MSVREANDEEDCRHFHNDIIRIQMAIVDESLAMQQDTTELRREIFFSRNFSYHCCHKSF